MLVKIYDKNLLVERWQQYDKVVRFGPVLKYVLQCKYNAKFLDESFSSEQKRNKPRNRQIDR